MFIPLFLPLRSESFLRKGFLIMARTKEFNESEILDKAMELFWTKGYNATSAQDLVDTLGISRSSLYDTFGDKHSLFVKVLSQYQCKNGEQMMAMMDNSTNVEQTVINIFKGIITDSLEDKDNKGCFMVNCAIELAPHDAKVNSIIKTNMANVEAAFIKGIERGQAEGVFTQKHSAQSLARFLINAISGLRVSAKSGADKKVLDEVIAVTLSALK